MSIFVTKYQRLVALCNATSESCIRTHYSRSIDVPTCYSPIGQLVCVVMVLCHEIIDHLKVNRALTS